MTKIKWPGFEPPRLKDKNLVARVALECDGKLNCKYDHVFSNAYIGRIAVDWMCVPTGESRTKEFLREVPRMKNGEEPLSLILSCF